MTRPNLISLLALLGYPVINVIVVYAIVLIDNWFLISWVYVGIFGVVIPLIVLVCFWVWLLTWKLKGKGWLLPIFATLAILLGGGLHFFINTIAVASV